MEVLLRGEYNDDIEQDESVTHIFNNFRSIEDDIPDEICDSDTLPYFVDWLIENVYFVEITAYSESDAYTIFETMNDRGLSLTPVEMLKGYLLANIADPDTRNNANNLWQKRVSELHHFGKEQDSDAIKAWLRSQYAMKIRAHRQGAKSEDFELIATEFHRWVRDHEDRLDITSRHGGKSFFDFIRNDFQFYTNWYIRILKAEEDLQSQLGIEAIYRNAQNNFTLQPTILLASLSRTDNEKEIVRKLRIVAAFIDILIARRVWNLHAVYYSAIHYTMFQIILKIRGKNVQELTDILCKILEDEEDFGENCYLHQQNSRMIHNLLARMTEYLEVRAGCPSRYSDYIQRGGKNGYELEHILANHYERYQDEFDTETDFGWYRNRIGGLLLLPKSFNASFGDKSYLEKREHYYGQNLLAQSLVERTYSNNPRFIEFKEKSGLPFRPHAEFRRTDLEARQNLYRQLADTIWNSDVLRREAGS